MNDKQKQILVNLVISLAANKPSAEQQKLIDVFSQRKPKMFAWAQRMSYKVRVNVLNNWADTYAE